MTNIDKALETAPRPWKADDVDIVDANSELIFILESEIHDRECDRALAKFIAAAVNAYEPEKVCAACGGAGRRYWEEDNAEVEARVRREAECDACKGTGKQPDEDEDDCSFVGEPYRITAEDVARVKATRNIVDLSHTITTDEEDEQPDARDELIAEVEAMIREIENDQELGPLFHPLLKERVVYAIAKEKGEV